MHVLLSALFGAFLTTLIYGLSFIPTATLSHGDDVDEAIERTLEDKAERGPDEVT